MTKPQRKSEHPYISQSEEICGGSPVISGTRFTVRSIVNYVFKLGFAPEELTLKFRNIDLAQIYDALSYYYDHKESLDREINENSIEACQREFSALA